MVERLNIPDGVVFYRGRFDPPAQHIMRYTVRLDAATLVEVGYGYSAHHPA
jgi:hypothetical protein